jgi:hypothetical protein
MIISYSSAELSRGRRHGKWFNKINTMGTTPPPPPPPTSREGGGKGGRQGDIIIS